MSRLTSPRFSLNENPALGGTSKPWKRAAAILMLLMRSALDRIESRELHRRADYPITDPLRNGKAHTVRRHGEAVVFDWAPLEKQAPAARKERHAPAR